MSLTLREQLDTVSTSEYATLHNVCEQRVRALCEDEGRIPGARKEGRNWRIPRAAPYPEDARFRKKHA